MVLDKEEKGRTILEKKKKHRYINWKDSLIQSKSWKH